MQYQKQIVTALEKCYAVSRLNAQGQSRLLVAAEKLLGDETVYRMLSLTVDQTEPTAAEFTLPDGTFLW